jgi:hypothetical protein
VGDLARHEELKCFLRSGVVAQIDKPLIDDFRAGFGRDVAPQIDIQLARDLQIVRRPGIAHRIAQGDAAPARNGNQRIDVRGFAGHRFHRLQVLPRQRPDNFQVAQLFGADVHQQVFAGGIVAVEALNGILHRGCQLAIRAAELLEKHVSEPYVRIPDAHCVHKLLNVMVHGVPPIMSGLGAHQMAQATAMRRS